MDTTAMPRAGAGSPAIREVQALRGPTPGLLARPALSDRGMILTSPFLGCHPRIHFLRQHIERHRAAAQDDIVEFFD